MTDSEYQAKCVEVLQAAYNAAQKELAKLPKASGDIQVVIRGFADESADAMNQDLKEIKNSEPGEKLRR